MTAITDRWRGTARLMRVALVVTVAFFARQTVKIAAALDRESCNTTMRIEASPSKANPDLIEAALLCAAWL